MTIMSLKDKQIHQESLLWTEARRHMFPCFGCLSKHPIPLLQRVRITLLPLRTYSQFPMTFGIFFLLEIQLSHQAINRGIKKKSSLVCLSSLRKRAKRDSKCKVLPCWRKRVTWFFKVTPMLHGCSLCANTCNTHTHPGSGRKCSRYQFGQQNSLTAQWHAYNIMTVRNSQLFKY